MTDAKTNQMIKREVIDALKRSSFDVQKAEFRSYPSMQAKTVLNKVKMESQKSGKLNQNQIEALVDGEVAYLSFWQAYGVGIIFDLQIGRQPNQKSIKEARDAIAVLRSVGRDESARIHEDLLMQKIGKG